MAPFSVPSPRVRPITRRSGGQDLGLRGDVHSRTRLENHRDPRVALLQPWVLPFLLSFFLLAAASALAPSPAWGATPLALSASPPQVPDVESSTPADLRSLFDEGFLVADRNGDGHADHVEARLLLPTHPGAAEVVAAANLAARLGFESYGADLDLVRLDSPEAGGENRPLVVVGQAETLLGEVGVDPRLERSDLVAGEGAVRRLPPSSSLPAGGVWISGADDTGLLKAAEYLAGRYPGVWAPDGPSWADQAERILQHLAEEGAEGNEVGLELGRAVFSAARPGIIRISATLRAGTPAGWDVVRTALDREGAAAELLVAGIHRMDLRVEGPEGALERRTLRPPSPWEAEDAPAWEPREVSPFTLSELFTIRGLYRDSADDLLPDRIEAWISLHGAAAAQEAVALALRVAHEATGLRVPLVELAGGDDPPADRGFPILFGVDHFTTLRLREDGVLGTLSEASLPPGTGFVELVEEALEDRAALVIGGSDEAGLAAAARLVSERFPHLHRHERGAYGLRDLEEEVRRFFQARGVAGQTALALVKLEEWLDRLEAGERPGIPPSDQARASDPEAPGWRPATPLQSLRVELAVDTVPPGLESHIRDRISSRFPDLPLEVELAPSAFGAGEEIFVEERRFEWEMDEAWRALREEVLAEVGPESQGRIEVRVSEPPEVRRELARAVSDSLMARGADPERLEVSVLNAYKQGFSWIQDQIIPRLQDESAAGEIGTAARVEIEYHHLRDSDDLRWQVVGSDTRWLQELFPVEEILARELGIADSAVVFQGVSSAEDIYRLRILDGSGATLLEETFSPRYQVIPYFALHPEYERVRVSTGWIRAELDGRTVTDRRIPTDMERFWAFWQEEVQPSLRDYVLDLHDGEVTPASAPFFDELRIEARLSEPNHRIGIDEEVISSLESLHNDLYFSSLAFFSHLGEHYGVGGLNYPGRILPFIDPSGDGRPGWARVMLTGRSRAGPEIVIRVESDGSERLSRWRYSLDPLPTERPIFLGIRVREAAARGGSEGMGEVSDPPDRGLGQDDADRIERIFFEISALDSVGRFDEHRDSAPEGTVDRTLLSVEMLEGMVEAVRELHGAGILEEALSFQGVDETAFRFRVERAEDFRRTVLLPASARPASTERPRLRAGDFDPASREGLPEEASMVQWETPIPPPESDSILARLGTFPEAEVYHVGRSFLGKDLWSADFLPPVEAAFRSRPRLVALRPTVFLSGRQHANEVSSTSHLLRLGELLVTNPEYRALLDRVNVVLNPILNADGAQLAYDMQLVNPDFTLHAGYLGALGMDVTSGSGDDPLYPESKVRPEIMEAWLPDAYLNLHGYPSHEWVQHFSGYAAWVRGRTVTQRAWWAPRGWFIPGFTYVDDPDHPEIKEAQFAILDTLAASITSLPEVEAMSRRQYARYARYGRQDVEGFREGFHEGMLVYLSLRGREATGEGPQDPRILTFSATTEAPDETARGEWLELVAGAGLAHTSALIGYMAAGDPRVERTAETFQDLVTRTVSRQRPVLRLEESESEGSSAEERGPDAHGVGPDD